MLNICDLFYFNTEDICEPCQHRNITVTATKYCDECEEKYCESCALSLCTAHLTE
jgi:hypothetical protein